MAWDASAWMGRILTVARGASGENRLRFKGIVTVLALVGVLASPSLLQAQAKDGDDRWADLAIGFGSARVFCGSCNSGPHLDGYNFQFGGGLARPHFRFGLVLDVWQHVFPDAETRQAFTTVTASAQYYPRLRGLFFEGGLGLSDYRMLKGLRDGLLFENADTTYFSGLGVGGTFGVGYDVRISHWVALSPRVAYAFGTPRSLHSPNGSTVATRSTQNVFEATVAVLVHTPD